MVEGGGVGGWGQGVGSEDVLSSYVVHGGRFWVHDNNNP